MTESREQPRGASVEARAPTDLKSVRARFYATYRTNQGNAGVDDRAVRAPYLRRLIARHIPKDRRVRILDVGCGSGSLVFFAREAGYADVHGVDISPEQVALAGTLGIVGVECGDLLEALRMHRTASLDVVVTLDVLEHLTRVEALELADEIARVLVAGGQWVIHVPNAAALFGARARYADWTHEQSFTPESARQFLSATGFEAIRCFEDVPVVHGVISAMRWLIWQSLRAVLSVIVLAEKGSFGGGAVFSQNMLVVAKSRGRRVIDGAP